MITLATIAHLRVDELFRHRVAIMVAMVAGSVIAVDNGVKTLAAMADSRAAYREEILPHLLRHLETCRPKDVPQHAERIAPAVGQSG